MSAARQAAGNQTGCG